MTSGLKSIKQGLILVLICFMGVGCTTSGKSDMAVLPSGDAGQTAPSIPPDYSAGRAAEGSLWNESRGSMFEDTRANHVGDTVIVDIVENSSSKMDVNTESSRKSAMNVGTPTINVLGYETALGGRGTPSLIGTSFDNSFAGEAESDRAGQVTASISARVVEVLPNGNLSLFGRRAMKVDNEVQYITVSGVIRPQDISATNRVQSTYLADSRIEYYGKGALSDKQKPGWGTRIIDNIWPW
ncbi:MAG: flagellar basal body L-ring protein FlgH [Desulfobacter sp.]|nr:flagellar basal body L-ring protein FlgH [Desulfobacter sp.]